MDGTFYSKMDEARKADADEVGLSELLCLLREIVMRNRLVYPQNDQDLEWWNEEMLLEKTEQAKLFKRINDVIK